MTDVQNNKQDEELAGKAVSKKRIASLDTLRKTALSCMWRLMNMRGNHRSVCARAWPCCNLIVVIVVVVVVVVVVADDDIDLVAGVGLAAIVHVLAAQTMIMTHGSGSQGSCS
jgi:cytochrome bd-type quinol oxidase subunit 2